MKKWLAVMTLVLAVCFAGTAHAQNFKTKQKEQERNVKAAYKAKKITQNEYEKLMEEQETIKHTIEKYELDGELDSHEKNTIHDKLVRSMNRLKKYKTNGEIY